MRTHHQINSIANTPHSSKTFRTIACKLALILSVHLVSLITETTGFASLARNVVLGSGENGFAIDSGSGAFSYDDFYSIFYNPGLIHNYSDTAIIEKTNRQTSISAQGGGVFKLPYLIAGVFINRGSALSRNFGNRTLMQPIDFLFGSEFKETKLGFSITHASYSNSTDSDYFWGLNLGLTRGDLELFSSLSPLGRTENKTTSSINKIQNYRVGARYHWGEWVPFVAIRTEPSTNSKFTAYGLGVARNAFINSRITLNLSTGLWFSNSTDDGFRTVVPFELSLEATAVEWFIFRAGLTSSIVNRSSKFGGSNPTSSTAARLGAALRFGKLDFDWAIGSSAVAENTIGSSFDLSNGFFTLASLSYKL